MAGVRDAFQGLVRLIELGQGDIVGGSLGTVFNRGLGGFLALLYGKHQKAILPRRLSRAATNTASASPLPRACEGWPWSGLPRERSVLFPPGHDHPEHPHVFFIEAPGPFLEGKLVLIHEIHFLGSTDFLYRRVLNNEAKQNS